MPLRDLIPVIPVDMPVHHIRGMVCFQDLFKAAEAPVRKVIEIADPERRRMGHEHIDPSASKQPGLKFQDPVPHAPFRIHIDRIPPVPVRASETGEPDAFVCVNAPVDGNASLGRMFGKCVVMVPRHVEQRTVRERDQELEILPVKVSAGDDQVDPVKPPRAVMLVIRRRYNIRNCKDLHFRRSSVFLPALSSGLALPAFHDISTGPPLRS